MAAAPPGDRQVGGWMQSGAGRNWRSEHKGGEQRGGTKRQERGTDEPEVAMGLTKLSQKQPV